MKLSTFLNDIKQNQSETIFFTCNHILSKKYDVENDSIEESQLKELFTDYTNFTKLLNDSAGVIYRRFQTDLNDIYSDICSLFNEDFDNKSLFAYRLARVVNQDAKQFLDIEDKDTQETVVQKFEDKINIILESKYYSDNKDSLSKELIIPIQTLEHIKTAANL